MTDDKTTPDNETPEVDADLPSDTHVAGSTDDGLAEGADAAAPADDATATFDLAYDDPDGAVYTSPAGDEVPVSDSAAPAAAATSDAAAPADGIPPQYGVGPFSVREVALGGIWLLAFIVSFFPIYGGFGSGVSVWNGGIDWVLTVGLPTAAVFLLVLRRLSPQGIRRVGSLGIDQFASVAFSVSTIIWLGILWSSFVSFAGGRVFIATWVVWVEFFLMLAGVFLTVFAPFIAPFNEDFRHRAETVAHRVARPARAVTARPTASVPAAAADPYASAAAAPYAAAPTEAYPPTQSFAPADEQQAVVADEMTTQQPATQAFWALAPVERDVVDENGTPLFRIGPTAWALVIEDRGDTFVVRHEDGRIGYLTDVSGVTRG